MDSGKVRNGVGLASLLLWSALSLAGCGQEEDPADTDPPDDPMIKLEMSQGKYRFGVIDTISIAFSEDIDTAGMAVAIAPREGMAYRFQGRDQMLLYGTAKTSGTPHFNINSPFSLSLAGIKDMAGNGIGEFSADFQPHAWVDQDFLDSTFSSYDSLFTPDSAWVGGRPMTDSLITEGWLNFNNNFGKEDRQDFKIVRILAPDSLQLEVSCAKSLNIRMQVAGPFKEAGLETRLSGYPFDSSFASESTAKIGHASVRFAADFLKHLDDLGSPAAPGIYAIRLSIPADTKGFYRLGMRLVKHKKSP